MSGPIVRSGPSTTYTKNWSSVFGGGSGETPAAKKTTSAKSKAKAAPKKKAKKKG